VTRPYSRIMPVPRWSELAVPRRVDLLIAAALLVWGLPDVPWWWEPPGHAGSALNVLGSLALTFAMSVPFCWRRSFPLPVLGAAAGVLAIRGALSRNEISAFAAVLVAAYGLGAYGRTTRRYARWLGYVSLIVAVVVVVTSHGGYRLSGAPYALLGAAFVLGDAASARRGESSARLSESAAAVEAAHQAERTRIARELHDVVAHQLSAIAVQAGAARLADGARLADAAQRARRAAEQPASSSAVQHDPAVQQDPAEVLRAIEQLSREALTELNHLLGALRREPEADPDRRPTPTLGDLDVLLDTSTAAGPPVNLVIEGPAHPLSPGVELSAYRIIQEALANAARHAPAARVNVTLRYGAGELGIEVTNAPSPRAPRPTGPPAAIPGGRGIRGMRERAELYGGHLGASAGADGGFTVTGVIPYDGSAPSGPAPDGPAPDDRASRAAVPASGSR
jgi:signal transduction histidine kinase